MKNIGASVSAGLTQEQRAVKGKEVEEKKYTWKANETVFYLKENHKCQIAVGGEWHGNARGEVLGSVDIYFRHYLTGRRCESVWDAIDGYACSDDKWADDWETLGKRIEDIADIEKIVCTERSMMISEK